MRAPPLGAPAAALACLVTACGTGARRPTRPRPGRPRRRRRLPRAEGTLRLLARQGYAESSWVEPFERSTGCRVEVRYADGAESLRRAAGGYAFDVASIPGSIAYAVVQDGSARALNPALVPQRARFRAPFRDPAAARAGARRYGVSFLWTPRLELWRKSIRKHAPATWAPLAWNTKARLGRVALEDTPLEIGDAALVAAQAPARPRDHRSVCAQRGAVRRGRGAHEAAHAPRRARSGSCPATRSTPSTAASSTWARATGTRRARSATRTSTSA